MKNGSFRRRLVDAFLGVSSLHNSLSTPFGRVWADTTDLLCFSHLRWDFVFQRPQHLMTRFAKRRRVYFIEEPIFESHISPRLDVSCREDRLCVVTPHLAHGLTIAQQHGILQNLLDAMVVEQNIRDYVAWYYTPMALGFTRQLHPRAVVYDCMDELSAFKGAPPSLLDHEAELLHRANVVFTGGQSLYEAKRNRHHNIYPFPSSIDRAHFGKARNGAVEPADQASIAGPKIGFSGVIDERMDIDLVGQVAKRRPEWQFVFLGPIVKIDPALLPKGDNLHYLGQKNYTDLPAYMAGWEAAILPFAHNESTRYISPTKTPEYLAAGKPVVSTSIRDVVRPYGERGFVGIADQPDAFERAIEEALSSSAREPKRWKEIDAFLSQSSWDQTWGKMEKLISDAVMQRLNRRRGGRAVETERRRSTPIHNGRIVKFFDRRRESISR